MKLNIHSLARTYAKGFHKFLKYSKIGIKGEVMYSLFSYSIKSICGLEATEYNSEIRKHGSDCIAYLSRLKGTPKDLTKLSFEDKANLVSLSCVWVVVLEGKYYG